MIRADVDLAPVAVGVVMATAGALFLVQSVVDTVAVGSAAIPPFVLSAGVLALGFGLGTVVYLRRGRRLVGIAHGIAGVGFGLFFVAVSVGSGLLVWAGAVVIAAGAFFLVDQLRRR